MEKEDLIEMDGTQYLVYDEIKVKEENYYLLCPVIGGKVKEEDVLIAKEADGFIEVIDENEDKETFKELVGYFKKEMDNA